MAQVDVKQKAKEIAHALQEEAYGPLVTIERLIRHIGLDFVEAIFPRVESEELKKLKTAATTLRQRLSAMEVSGQKGIKMTQKLLANTRA